MFSNPFGVSTSHTETVVEDTISAIKESPKVVIERYLKSEALQVQEKLDSLLQRIQKDTILMGQYWSPSPGK